MIDSFDAFFSRYAQLEPQEVTTLGLPGHEHRLRDMGDAGEAARADLWRATETWLTSWRQPASDPAELDRRTLLRHARFEQHAIAEGLQRGNPHWALFPYSMLRYQAAYARASQAELTDPTGPYRAVAASVPRFLANHRSQLERERDAGRVAHRTWLESLIERELPGTRPFLARLDPEAALALDTHIDWLREQLLPHAPESTPMGAAAYAQRMLLMHGVTDTLDDLVRAARDDLSATQAAMVRVASSLSGGEVRDLPGVVAWMAAAQREPMPPGTDMEAYYRQTMRDAMARLVAHGEYAPFDTDAIGMEAFPEAMAEAHAGTNWPAPLLDPDARGQFVIRREPEAHPAAWATQLAVHEGVPGHFLQSRGFQRRFRGSTAPVRFLAVADDVAIPRGNFGAMLNIEGYALYAEATARRAGVFEGRDELFALASHAIRAVRVIAEIGLHTEQMTRVETEAFIVAESGLPSGAWEVERYLRGPHQAVAYWIGARQITALRAHVERVEGGAFDPVHFHDRLFEYGPALPSDIAEAWG